MVNASRQHIDRHYIWFAHALPAFWVIQLSFGSHLLFSCVCRSFCLPKRSHTDFYTLFSGIGALRSGVSLNALFRLRQRNHLAADFNRADSGVLLSTAITHTRRFCLPFKFILDKLLFPSRTCIEAHVWIVCECVCGACKYQIISIKLSCRLPRMTRYIRSHSRMKWANSGRHTHTMPSGDGSQAWMCRIRWMWNEIITRRRIHYMTWTTWKYPIHQRLRMPHASVSETTERRNAIWKQHTEKYYENHNSIYWIFYRNEKSKNQNENYVCTSMECSTQR